MTPKQRARKFRTVSPSYAEDLEAAIARAEKMIESLSKKTPKNEREGARIARALKSTLHNLATMREDLEEYRTYLREFDYSKMFSWENTPKRW